MITKTLGSHSTEMGLHLQSSLLELKELDKTKSFAILTLIFTGYLGAKIRSIL
jgi:hypothetical protein